MPTFRQVVDLVSIPLQGLVPERASTPPATADGRIYYDTTEKALRTYRGGAWQTLGAPAGVMEMWPTTTAPSGYLLCNGATYNVATYPALAGVLGSRFGGDGVTTFAVPNMTGRMPLGADSSRTSGAKGGSETKVLSASNLPPHTHTIAHTHQLDVDHQANTSTTGTGVRVTDVGERSGGGGTNDTATTFGASVPDSGSGPGSSVAFDVMNPWLAIHFIIKT